MESDTNILQVNNLSKYFGGLSAVSNCSLRPFGVCESLTKCFKSFLELTTASSDRATKREVMYF